MDSIEYKDVKTGVIVTMIVLHITVNSLLISVLVKYAELREDRTALFMMSLSIADVGIGLTALPISAVFCSGFTPRVQHLTQYLPEINMVCQSVFGVASMHSQAWVAFSKMISVSKPLRYEQLLSRNRCYGIIGSTWIFGAAVAASRLILSPTWNTDTCWFTFEAHNRSVSALVLVLYLVSLVCPELVLTYASVRIFVVVARAHSQVSSQVQSISGGADDSGMVTLKAIRSARNVLVICFVALALSVPFFLHMIIVYILREERVVFSFFAFWLVRCNSFMNSFLYMVLHRSIRQKLRVMFTGLYESCRCD